MWILKSGEVVVDRFKSHLHQSVMSRLSVALLSIESKGRAFLVEEVDFGQLIGETICVSTGSSDTIVFARRPKRFGLTRFVKNRKAEPCSSIVVILKTADGQPGAYVLISAFIGQKAEPEPWDRYATKKSVAFWNSHALIWGSEPIIVGTETQKSP